MPPLAHPSGSPLVLHAGKADTGSCRAQSGVSAAKAAGARGKQAAARDALSSSRERVSFLGMAAWRHFGVRAASLGLAPSPTRLRGQVAPLSQAPLWELVFPLCQPRQGGTQGSW